MIRFFVGEGRATGVAEGVYRQQARVENSFLPIQVRVRRRPEGEAQQGATPIGCHILNRMAELGRPSSYALGR